MKSYQSIAEFPVREFHEIELSSRCNLACKYCPHPKMTRAKADMTEEVFAATLEHLKYLCAAGTQGEVSLTGIGEAILHPDFIRMMWRVREIVRERPMVLATNGVALTHAIASEIVRAQVIVYVSTHRPEKAGPAFELMKELGGQVGLNTAFVNSSIDWAGQVNWFTSAKPATCEYLRSKWVAIRQDGSVNTCCMDALSLVSLGTVFDAPGSLRTRVTKICEGCHLAPPPGYAVVMQPLQEARA